jgi:hypothetical protein
MQETGNNITKSARLTIRVCRDSLRFAVADAATADQIVYEPYITKSGISMAANLRDAFKTSDLLSRGYHKAMLVTDSPVLLIPVEEFHEEEKGNLYAHSFPDIENHLVVSNILPTLNAVAVYSINKDLKLVTDDHFSDVKIIPLMQPVWSYLHQRSFTGIRRKMYGYFHDKKLDIVSFDKNRFKFCNTFDAAQSRDSAYFLLYVWKLLAMDSEKDEMHLVGEIPDKEWLIEAMHRYLRQVYVINPSADFNRAPITKIKGMTLDMMTLFIKGR